MQLDTKQQEAIARCSSIERIVPVTGAAGTGKTTIIKESYTKLRGFGYSPVLCAPTGKAAKRITEATGIPAMTIHRLLEYTHPGDPDPNTGKPRFDSYPRRDRQNPVEFDCVIGDEFAMVNWEVYRNLRDAIPPGGLLRVFGDANQLPPIESDKRLHGKPTPFNELLTKFNGVVLDKIYRQGEGSGIVSNGARILRGSIPVPADGFTRAISERPLPILEDYVMSQLERGIDFSSLQHQIITPTKRGWCGTRAVNALMQNIFRTEDEGWVELPRHFTEDQDVEEEPVRVRIGDKVIVTQNNYFVRSDSDQIGVFNGEVGIVYEADVDMGMIRINFGDRICDFPPDLTIMNNQGKFKTIDPRKDIDLAYCVTTHKAQGSEYEHVVYILNQSTGRLRTRSNFYTAVTRAKKHCHIICDQRSLSYAVYNNQQV